MILITSTGELLLYFNVIFFSFHKKKKKTMLQDCFYVPFLYCRITCPVGLNCDQWKREGNTVSIQWRVTLEHTYVHEGL